MQKSTYILTKLHKKLLSPELPFLTQLCTKSFVGWSSAPDPTGGDYSALPDPLAVFRGLLLREEKGGERWGGDTPDPLAWGLQCLNLALLEEVTVANANALQIEATRHRISVTLDCLWPSLCCACTRTAISLVPVKILTSPLDLPTLIS